MCTRTQETCPLCKAQLADCVCELGYDDVPSCDRGYVPTDESVETCPLCAYPLADCVCALLPF